MGSWEYEVLYMSPKDKNYVRLLSELGRDCWELVGFPAEGIAVFKRRCDGIGAIYTGANEPRLPRPRTRLQPSESPQTESVQ